MLFQLESLGFDAFVIDLLEGPPDVLAYLCYSSNLHRIVSALEMSSSEHLPDDRVWHPNSLLHSVMAEMLRTSACASPTHLSGATLLITTSPIFSSRSTVTGVQ